MHVVDESLVGPAKLLDQCWFFGNGKATMKPITSVDPRITSSSDNNNLCGKSYEETYESIEKLSVQECRAPACMESRNDAAGRRRRRLNQETTSSKNLLLEPSLPTDYFEQEEEEEMEFSMGKLIRQASLNHPPKKQGVTAASSLIHQPAGRKSEVDSEDLEKIMRPQRLMSQLKTQKSLSALASQELQGCKDLGFDFDNKNSNPGGVSNPGLKEKMMRIREKDVGERKLTRTQSWAPPVPVGKRSTEEDLKAQIKFWARAVASNVHQE